MKNKKAFSKLLAGFFVLIILVLIYVLFPSPKGGMNAPRSVSSVNAGTPATPSPQYELTAPDGVLGISKGGNSEFKIFGISITKDGYSRDLIVANEGDTVYLSVRAGDGAYDLFFPSLHFYSGQIAKGGTISMNLGTLRAGEYDFECQTYCPYGSRISGKVVVLPSNE